MEYEYLRICNSMENKLTTDFKGERIGVCRNRVWEAEDYRRKETAGIETTSYDFYPSVSGTYIHSEAPGFLGGDV